MLLQRPHLAGFEIRPRGFCAFVGRLSLTMVMRDNPLRSSEPSTLKAIAAEPCWMLIGLTSGAPPVLLLAQLRGTSQRLHRHSRAASALSASGCHRNDQAQPGASANGYANRRPLAVSGAASHALLHVRRQPHHARLPRRARCGHVGARRSTDCVPTPTWYCTACWRCLRSVSMLTRLLIRPRPWPSHATLTGRSPTTARALREYDGELTGC